MQYLYPKRKSVEQTIDLENPSSPQAARYLRLSDQEFASEIQKSIQEMHDLMG